MLKFLDEGSDSDSGKRTLRSMQNLMCIRSMEKFEAELLYWSYEEPCCSHERGLKTKNDYE